MLAQVLELEKAAANSNKDHEERAEVIRSQETQLAQKDTQIAALETDLTEARSRLQSNDASVADTAPEDASADGEASGADTLPKADADDAATGVINTPDPEETVSRADTEGSAAASATTTAEEPLSVDSTDGAAPDADPDARPYEQDSSDSFLAEDISAMSDMPSLNNYLSGVQMIEKALELARKKVNTQVMSLRAEEKFSAYVTANTSPTTKNTDSEIAAFFVNRGTRIEKL